MVLGVCLHDASSLVWISPLHCEAGTLTWTENHAGEENEGNLGALDSWTGLEVLLHKLAVPAWLSSQGCRNVVSCYSHTHLYSSCGSAGCLSVHWCGYLGVPLLPHFPRHKLYLEWDERGREKVGRGLHFSSNYTHSDVSSFKGDFADTGRAATFRSHTDAMVGLPIHITRYYN